jgi:hypothetical protein
VKQVQANLNVVEDEDVDFHDISSGQESVPIRMYGDTSTLKRLKSEFVSYITSPVMSPCVRIDWKQSVETCCVPTSQSEKNVCSVSKCSHGSRFLECNRMCECANMNDMKCGNRLTQHGVGVSLEVFWTGRERRWGVRSLQSITKGDFVCIYAGEIVPIGCKCEHNCTNENCVHMTSCPKCVAQGKTKIRNSQAYVFELKARSGQKANDKNKVCKYGIDGRRYRNIGPFFNHACSGFNIEPRFLYSEHLDKDIPTVAFFAKRNIKPNEEILLNYGHKLPGCRCTSCRRK